MSSHGKDGVFECAEMQWVIDGLGSSTRVLVASLRSASQLTTLAAQGCGTFTFSPAIAAELLDEPLTTASAADFEAAALAMG
jgi:transaldolase